MRASSSLAVLGMKVKLCTAPAAVGTEFACAWQGKVEPDAAAEVAGALYGMGCYEVSMCDTTGTGTPATITAMFQVSAEADSQWYLPQQA